MGPSGSGKSTLLNLAGGLDSGDGGEGSGPGGGARVARKQTALAAPLRRRRVGYVFQDYNLIPSLTAVENVALPLELNRVRTGVAMEAARTVLDQVGLEGLYDRFPENLSGGQQQRVAIARAVVGDRCLDLSPTSPRGALDSETGDEVLALLGDRCEAGAAALLVTHEARHAGWADRVVFLKDGTVVDETGADPVETLVEAR